MFSLGPRLPVESLEGLVTRCPGQFPEQRRPAQSELAALRREQGLEVIREGVFLRNRLARQGIVPSQRPLGKTGIVCFSCETRTIEIIVLIVHPVGGACRPMHLRTRGAACTFAGSFGTLPVASLYRLDPRHFHRSRPSPARRLPVPKIPPRLAWPPTRSPCQCGLQTQPRLGTGRI